MPREKPAPRSIWPLFRRLAGLGFVGMLIGYVCTRQVGWITDLGPRSEQARQVEIDNLNRDIGSPDRAWAT